MDFNTYETHKVIFDVIKPASFDDLDNLFTDDLLDESKVAQFVIDNLHWVIDKQSFLDEVDADTIMDAVMDSYESKTYALEDDEIEYLQF